MHISSGNTFVTFAHTSDVVVVMDADVDVDVASVVVFVQPKQDQSQEPDLRNPQRINET